eukprot:7071590-Pyramimonas_sp.AAC.1
MEHERKFQENWGQEHEHQNHMGGSGGRGPTGRSGGRAQTARSSGRVAEVPIHHDGKVGR